MTLCDVKKDILLISRVSSVNYSYPTFLQIQKVDSLFPDLVLSTWLLPPVEILTTITMCPTILTILFLLSSSIELTLVLGQFGGGEPCTPGTAPPPVLRPLDSDASMSNSSILMVHSQYYGS